MEGPVFVLTHHPRPSIVMEGGTTFHFIEGVEGLERKYEIEAVSSPSGVTHMTFTRAGE